MAGCNAGDAARSFTGGREQQMKGLRKLNTEPLFSARWHFAALVIATILIEGCMPHSSKSAKEPAATIRFTDVTRQAGLHFKRVNGAFGKKWMPETMGGGGAFLDYDSDGRLDILLVNGDWWKGHPLSGERPTLKLFRNEGHGAFTDVTKAASLKISLQGMGVAVGDYDNDGYDDLCITRVGGSRLFRNIGGRRFEDVTAKVGLRDSGWSTSAAWLDHNNDGWLDLFVCHYVRWSPETDIFCGSVEKAYCRPLEYPGESCRLYRNEGGKRFVDVTRTAGIFSDESKALGVCVLDIDGDHWPDLVIANDTQPNFVFRNKRNGTFEEVGYPTGIALDENGRARAGMGIDAAFYDKDRVQAIAIGNFNYEGIAFYPLTGSRPYPERAKQAGLFQPSYPYITFGLFFADFDNDGWPDLFVTNGHIEDNVESKTGETYAQPNLLFRNRGDGTFADASRAAGEAITQPLVGRGACRGDYDNDGKIDILLIPNIGPPRLLRNETPNRRHWWAAKLVGTRSNRNGYGAFVKVEAGGRTQTAYARSGSSYLSANDTRLHFGLGAAARVERVTVRWPSGREEMWESLEADRITVLKEGTGRNLTRK